MAPNPNAPAPKKPLQTTESLQEQAYTLEPADIRQRREALFTEFASIAEAKGVPEKMRDVAQSLTLVTQNPLFACNPPACAWTLGEARETYGAWCIRLAEARDYDNVASTRVGRCLGDLGRLVDETLTHQNYASPAWEKRKKAFRLALEPLADASKVHGGGLAMAALANLDGDTLAHPGVDDQAERPLSRIELEVWLDRDVKTEFFKLYDHYKASGACAEADLKGFLLAKITLGEVAKSFRPLHPEGIALAKNLTKI